MALDAGGVVGQLAVEVRRLGHVVADPAGVPSWVSAARTRAGGQPGPVGQQVDLDPRLEGEQRADQLGVVVDLVARPGRPAPRPRRRSRGRARARGSAASRMPGAPAPRRWTGGEPSADRRPVHPQPAGVSAAAAPARPAAPGRAGRPRPAPAGRSAAATGRPAPPTRRAASAAGQRAQEPQPPRPPPARPAGRSRPRSPAPRRSRAASARAAAPSSPPPRRPCVVTASSSGPTARCSGSVPPTRASASRSGALTSTLVVPRSMHLAVEAVRQHVQAGVDAAAARERLEPQPVAVAGHHRVARARPLAAGSSGPGRRRRPPAAQPRPARPWSGTR